MIHLAAPGAEAAELSAVTDVDVLIVGAGFSGLAAATLLNRAGVASLRVLEAADDLGGAWRDNYPGCACDIPSPLYPYLFHHKSDWTRLFAEQPRSWTRARRRPLPRLDRTHPFRAAGRASAVDQKTGPLRVSTATGDRYRARFLISAVGPPAPPCVADPARHRPPRRPGISPGRWWHDVDLSGMCVVVVGTGASAIQFIIDRVGALTVFQRTPAWIVPKADRVFDVRHRWLARWFPLPLVGAQPAVLDS